MASSTKPRIKHHELRAREAVEEIFRDLFPERRSVGRAAPGEKPAYVFPDERVTAARWRDIIDAKIAGQLNDAILALEVLKEEFLADGERRGASETALKIAGLGISACIDRVVVLRDGGTSLPEKTIIRDRIQALGYEHTSELAWQVGNRARERWKKLTDGNLPEKALATKTAGGGSHMMAVYPPWFVAAIDEIIEEIGGARAAQFTLF